MYYKNKIVHDQDHILTFISVKHMWTKLEHQKIKTYINYQDHMQTYVSVKHI